MTAPPSGAAVRAAPAGRPIGSRATRQRAAVAELLRGVDDFRSAQQLHDLLLHEGQNVGLATVYRALQAMAAAGDIDVILASDGQSLYRRCGQGIGHHHHLVCRACGLTVEVEGPAVERWTHAVGVDNGFIDVSHTLDIFGVCATCAEKSPTHPA